MNADFKDRKYSYARRMFYASLRRYFAPLTGAVRGVRAELLRAERERKRPSD